MSKEDILFSRDFLCIKHDYEPSHDFADRELPMTWFDIKQIRVKALYWIRNSRPEERLSDYCDPIYDFYNPLTCQKFGFLPCLN